MRSRLPIVIGALLVLGATGVLAILWGTGVIGVASSSAPGDNPASQAALSYARTRTAWTAGPTVQKVRTVRLSRLSAALRAAVGHRIAQDVNVADLEQRYGRNHEVSLVVLHGSFNSLPPDEGVPVNGDMVAIVDARTNTVVLLTD